MPTYSRIAASAAALLLPCTLALHAAEPASPADKAFTAKVSQGGMYEVEASKVAMERAAAANVKDLATWEVHDHQLVGENLKKTASASGVDFPGSLNAEFQQRLDKLKATPAGTFDQAYIADMKLIHAKDEKLFAAEALQGSTGYKPFAHETDLIVKRHIGALAAPVGR